MVPDADLAVMCQRARQIGYRTAKSCGCAHLGDELEGAALEGLARAVRTWDGDGEPRAYCYQLMVYACIDAARTWSGRRSLKMSAAPIETDWSRVRSYEDIEATVVARAELAEVARSIALMDPVRRDALLCTARGESQEDVARRYGVSGSWVSIARKDALNRHQHGVMSTTDRCWGTKGDA